MGSNNDDDGKWLTDHFTDMWEGTRELDTTYDDIECDIDIDNIEDLDITTWIEQSKEKSPGQLIEHVYFNPSTQFIKTPKQMKYSSIDDGWSRLQRACINGRLLEVMNCIENGDDIWATDNQYLYTAMHCTAYGGNFDVMAYLMEQSVIDMAKHRLRDCSDQSITDYFNDFVSKCTYTKCSQNRTMLDVARDHKNFYIMRYLMAFSFETVIVKGKKFIRDRFKNTLIETLSNGKSPNVRFDDNAMTALHHACEQGWIDVVQKAIDFSAHLDLQDAKMFTALHYACQYNHLAIVKLLIENGANKKIRSGPKGDFPVVFAQSQSYDEIVEYLTKDERKAYLAAMEGDLKELMELQKLGIDLKSKYSICRDRSPLHAAAQNGHEKIVKYLLKECDIEPNDVDLDGWSPLHVCAEKGHLRIIKILVLYGAIIDMTTINPGKWEASDIAYGEGFMEIVDFLGDIKSRQQAAKDVELDRLKKDKQKLKQSGIKGIKYQQALTKLKEEEEKVQARPLQIKRKEARKKDSTTVDWSTIIRNTLGVEMDHVTCSFAEALKGDITDVIEEPSDILRSVITQIRKVSMSNLEGDGTIKENMKKQIKKALNEALKCFEPEFKVCERQKLHKDNSNSINDTVNNQDLIVESEEKSVQEKDNIDEENIFIELNDVLQTIFPDISHLNVNSTTPKLMVDSLLRILNKKFEEGDSEIILSLFKKQNLTRDINFFTTSMKLIMKEILGSYRRSVLETNENKEKKEELQALKHDVKLLTELIGQDDTAKVGLYNKFDLMIK